MGLDRNPKPVRTGFDLALAIRRGANLGDQPVAIPHVYIQAVDELPSALGSLLVIDAFDDLNAFDVPLLIDQVNAIRARAAFPCPAAM